MRVEVDGEVVVEVDTARVTLVTTSPTTITFGVGANAWEDWAAATNYTGPNEDAPSWCDGAPEGE